MEESTLKTLSILKDCVQHNGFTQLLSLQIQSNLNDEQRAQVVRDIESLINNP